MDRALDSPHYGEKWARYWLDLARYADSDGYEKDRSRPWAWRYRHWVIDALNRDMPFDQFTIEQLAGDLLPNRDIDTLVATGFNRNTLTNREGGTDPEQFRDEQVLDRAATLGTVWMGLTWAARNATTTSTTRSRRRSSTSSPRSSTRRRRRTSPRRCRASSDRTWPRGRHTTRQRQALFEQYKIPQNQADWEEKLRYAALHPGEHDDWSFAYGEFTHNVDNARKVLFMDRAQAQ